MSNQVATNTRQVQVQEDPLEHENPLDAPASARYKAVRELLVGNLGDIQTEIFSETEIKEAGASQ